MPSYEPNPNASFTTRAMHRFHELNELYDGTVNQLHHFSFLSMDVASNEVFTYHKAMNSSTSASFIALW